MDSARSPRSSARRDADGRARAGTNRWRFRPSCANRWTDRTFDRSWFRSPRARSPTRPRRGGGSTRFSIPRSWRGRRRARFDQGAADFDRGRFEAAAEAFDSLARDPSRRRFDREARARASAAHAHLGFFHFHAARDGPAERAFTRALEGSPDHARWLHYRARLYARSGRPEAAARDLERALDSRGLELESRLLLALCLERLGSRSAARGALAVALETLRGGATGRALATRPGPRMDASFDPSSPGDPATARGTGGLDHARHSVREQPSWPDRRCRLALALFAAGRSADAGVEIERALRINPRYLEPRLIGARLGIAEGAPRRAARQLERALEQEPRYPDLHCWLGIARLCAGDLVGARESLERAIDLHRHYARAHRMLGLAHAAAGRIDDAVRSLARGFHRDRTIEIGAESLGALSARAREPVGGLEPATEIALERAALLEPDYPDRHLALARRRRTRGDHAGARESCRRALALQPGYAAAAIEIARLDLECGRAREAETRLLAIVHDEPRWADALALLGRARVMRGDLDRAEVALRSALELNPGYGEARACLSAVREARLRARRSIEDPDRALQISFLETAVGGG